MTKPRPSALGFLLQLDVIGELLPKIGKDQWQTLYLSADDPPHRFGMWCALLDDDAAARAIGHDSWDLMIGDGKPGFSQSWPDGEEVTTYHRFGSRDGVRPLVLYRSFHGAFPQYVEVDEEFRLYHDLAEDKTRGLLLSFDESGREIEVVRFTPHEVRGRLKHLRQFQAGTGLHLAIYMDSIRYSEIPLAKLSATERERIETDGTTRWRRNVVKCDFKEEYESFSRLLCKVILAPPARDKAGVWPFKDGEDERAVAFIIGVEHLLDTVRIPVTNSQAEVDEQVGHLTKLLVDSLNEKELAARAGVLEGGAKGIAKLAGFLEATQFPERLSVVQLLRDLQALRSTGSAHRKGSAYERIIAKLGVDPTRKPDAVRRFLEEATAALCALRLHYCGEREGAG